MTTSVPARSRNLGLDALRGLAVLLMIQQHLGAWWTLLRGATGHFGPLLLRLNLMGGAAAPLFISLAGVSVGLSAHTQTSDRAWLVRGAGLLGFAYALNLLTPNWFVPVSFYVLHLLGIFWLTVPLLRRLGPRSWLLLAALVLALALWGQNAEKTLPLLNNVRMNDTSRPGGALRLALLEGHFPLLPWLAFALLGLTAGRLLREGQAKALTLLGATLLGLGLTFWISGALAPRLVRSLSLRRATAFSFYPASTAFVLLLGALSLALVLAAFTWGAQARLSPRQPLVALGRLSLTFFVLHVVVFRQWLPALGFFQLLSPGLVLLTLVPVLLGCLGLASLWARADFRYSLEWLLRRLPGAQ